MAELMKTVVEAMKTTNSPQAQQVLREMLCIMCGGKHSINDCGIVEDYIKDGKCYRNQMGRVVLPTGAQVPRAIQGKNLAERLDEWHRQHPNQLVAKTTPTLIHTIDRQLVHIPLPRQASQPQIQTPNYALSHDERIAAMEAEIYNIRRAKETAAATVRTRAQKAKAPAEVDEEQAVAAARKAIPRIEEVEDVDAAPRQPATSSSNSQPTVPEHPFRNARDGVYMPPVNRNIGAKPANFQRPDPAYKNTAPIHDPEVATKVYHRYLESPITLTNRELLSLSPEIRYQVRESTTTRRAPQKDANAQQSYLDQGEGDYDLLNLFNTVTEQPPSIPFAPTIPTLAIQSAHHRMPPEGATIIGDTFEAYYKSLRPGELPDPSHLIVAEENGAVRAIHATIDHSQKHECILDPGCQIIAMSEATCNELGLAYDPSIILNMESANGNINPSLGLARNVPFQIAKLTFYLQVHIIHSPAYDVLLGRPFDILTESIVRNFANEDQTITIRDPNTGTRATIPTLPRTRKVHRCPHMRKQDF